MAVGPSVDTDTWWHLSAGELIVERGEIIQTDPFSSTQQGEDWIYPGWLSQVFFFRLFEQFSFAGLNIFTGLSVLAAFLFIWPTLEGSDLLKAFTLILAAAASGVYWSARPQIVSFLLVGITIFLLERARNGKMKSIWVLPFLMALWANIHGGFAIAFILLSAYILADLLDMVISALNDDQPLIRQWKDHQDFIQTLLLVGLASAAAVSLNPHGPRMLLYPFTTLSIGALRDHIAEWQSPNFHSLQMLPFLIMFLLTMISIALSRKTIKAIDIVIPSLFGIMSFTAARNIALFALSAAPVLARHADDVFERLLALRKPSKPFPERIVKTLNYVLFSLFSIATLLKIVTVMPDEMNVDQIAAQIPLEAFDYIEEKELPGPIFNSYNWGGYLIWRLYPNYLSYVDGRTDLFGDRILDVYQSTWLAKPGWEDELRRSGIQLVLIEPLAPLRHALEARGWVLEFQDPQSVVYSMPARGK
jgi:hypothetical protein